MLTAVQEGFAPVAPGGFSNEFKSCRLRRGDFSPVLTIEELSSIPTCGSERSLPGSGRTVSLKGTF